MVFSSVCFPSTNRLVNGGAESGDFSNWTITANGGSGWGMGHKSGMEGNWAFISSYDWDTMQQDINLTARGYPAAYLDASPPIAIGDYVRGIMCNNLIKDSYHIEVYLLNATGATLATYSTGTLNAEWDWWIGVNYTFSGYPSGVRAIRFVQSGLDGGYCAGQYGTIFDNASVSFLDPAISFAAPTLANNTNTTNTTFLINISIYSAVQNLSSLAYSWNGTNYTYYNSSLVLMANFDNLSALGENATTAVDVSKNGQSGKLINGMDTRSNSGVVRLV